MSLIDKVLPRLKGPHTRKPNGGVACRCPAHENHHGSSLSIDIGADGRLLFKCFAGCSFDAIRQAFGLEHVDVFPERAAQPSRRSREPRTSRTLTVEELADAKGLPASFLHELGIAPRNGGLVIPYTQVDGAPARSRLRMHLKASAEGSSKWESAADLPIVAYGSEHVVTARQLGYLWIEEGESDNWTFRYHDIPAIGIPGATMVAKTLTREHVDGIPQLYVVHETDAAGDTFVAAVAARLQELGWSGSAIAVRMPNGLKDPNDLHRVCSDSAEFHQALNAAVAAGVPIADVGAKLVDVLTDPPETLDRPLRLISGHAYAATWFYVPDSDEPPAPAVVRDDGVIFCDLRVHPRVRPLDDLGLSNRLLARVPDRHLWRFPSVKQHADGQRVDAADVFRRVVQVIDKHVDFEQCPLAPPTTICELLACYVLGTYLLDAFGVAGYIGATGERGNGKTQLIKTIAELAYLGQFVTDGSSFASIRDLAGYGGFTGFDDAEKLMDQRTADPSKRELVLAGNRKGIHSPIKEQTGKSKKWETKDIHVFGPRGFSAIALPDGPLSSRTIMIPLGRTSRGNITDPSDYARWPISRRELLDDLWSVGLQSLRVVREFDGTLHEHTKLYGRLLDPWRIVLAVALWLQHDRGETDLFGRLCRVAEGAYQEQQADFESNEPVRLILRALGRVLPNLRERDDAGRLVFTTAAVVNEIDCIAKDEDLFEPTSERPHYMDGKRVGQRLRGIPMPKPKPSKPGPRRWACAMAEYERLCRNYGVAVAHSGIQEDGECLLVS